MKERISCLKIQHSERDSIAYHYLPQNSTVSFFFCTFSLVIREDGLVFLHDVGEEESSAHFTV